MDVVQTGCILAVHLLREWHEHRERKRRRWGTHPVLASRLSTGQFYVMFENHRMHPDKFFQHYRMSVASFDELLGLVCDKIRKNDTNLKKSIPPAERLVITLRYLASGMNFGDLEYDFKVSRKTIPLIVKETCEAIWEVLHLQEMPTPDKEMWLRKAKEFNEITNFPHCIGAVDGKRVRLQCPPNAGSLYYNFKKFNSIFLLAVCDAQFYFTAIDVGAYAQEGDSSIFKNSNFFKRLQSNQLDIPEDQSLPTNIHQPGYPKVPHVFLADEAFGLSRHVLRQYPSNNSTAEKKIYNYRHCRAIRTVECSFGILSNKWRVLHSCILVNPDFATVIVQCCCVLHNFVRRRDGYIFEDTLSCDMANMADTTAVEGRSNTVQIRDIFCEYFNGPGALLW